MQNLASISALLLLTASYSAGENVTLEIARRVPERLRDVVELRDDSVIVRLHDNETATKDLEFVVPRGDDLSPDFEFSATFVDSCDQDDVQFSFGPNLLGLWHLPTRRFKLAENVRGAVLPLVWDVREYGFNRTVTVKMYAQHNETSVATDIGESRRFPLPIVASTPYGSGRRYRPKFMTLMTENCSVIVEVKRARLLAEKQEESSNSAKNILALTPLITSLYLLAVQ